MQIDRPLLSLSIKSVQRAKNGNKFCSQDPNKLQINRDLKQSNIRRSLDFIIYICPVHCKEIGFIQTQMAIREITRTQKLFQLFVF